MLGIAVGIATVLSIQVVDHNTILTEQRLRQAATQPDWEVEIRPKRSRIPEGGAAPRALTEEADLAAFCGLFFQRVDFLRDENSEPVTASVMALGPFGKEFVPYSVESGRDLSGPAAQEVLVPGPMAAEHGITIGQSLTLQPMTPVRRLCREGEMVREVGERPEGNPLSFEVVGILTTEALAKQRLIVPFESAAEVFAESHVQPFYRGRLQEGAVYQDVRERLKHSFTVEKPKFALVGERIDQRAFRKSLRFTSTLALLLGLFVIYHCFSVALVERVREIGLLRAMGLKRREIAGAVLTEGYLLAIGGGALGVLLTVGIVKAMQAAQITTLGFGKPLTIHEVPWLVTAGVMALGVACALLGVTTPLLRARHLSVIDALRAGRLALRSDPGFSVRIAVFVGVPCLIPLFYVLAVPPLGERQEIVFDIVLKIALVLAAFFLLVLVFPGILHRLVKAVLAPLTALFPVEIPLTRAAIQGSRHRILGTLTGISVVVASIFCVRAVNQGFLREMDQFADVTMDDRIFIRLKDRAKSRVLDAPDQKIPGVERLYSLSAEIHNPFPVRGVTAKHAAENIQALREEPAIAAEFARGDGVIMSQFLADEHGYRLREEVSFSTQDGLQSFRIIAISDEFGYFPDDRSFALMEAERMDELFCVNGEGGNRYVAELTEGADRSAVVAALERKIDADKTQWIRSDHEIKETYLLDRRRDFYVFDVILWLVGILAGVGLLNSLTVAILERRREIGLLRTLGFTHSQIRRMIVLESLALGLVAGALSTALSVPLSSYSLEAVRVISRLGLSYEADGFALGMPMLTTLAIAVAGSLWPAMRSGRRDLAALSRYE